MTEHITQLELKATQGATRRSPAQREHAEQVALFKWAKLQAGRIPELGLLFAVPNGGKRGKATAGKLKAEGVKAGVPDICLPVARGGHHGLFIELKAQGGRPSDNQRNWMRALALQDYRVHLVYGWEMAKEVILDYLLNPNRNR